MHSANDLPVLLFQLSYLLRVSRSRILMGPGPLSCLCKCRLLIMLSLSLLIARVTLEGTSCTVFPELLAEGRSKFC